MLKQVKYISVVMMVVFSAVSTLVCNREAEIVTPSAITSSAVGSEPGYDYPVVVSTYPSGINVPNNTSAIIVFSIPIDNTTLIAANLTVNSSIDGSLVYTRTQITPTVVHITFSTPRPDNDTITISYTSGILSTTGIPLNNPGSFSFTTGTASDTTSPTVSVVNPPDTSTGISITVPNIYVQFSENIDPTTINSATIFVEDSGGNRLETAYAYISATYTATLTPTSYLKSGEVYTITVKRTGTFLIKDLSGNAITGADIIQTFTTDTPVYDPYGISPSITSGPAITSIVKTSTLVTWVTDQPTDYSFDYYGKAGSLGPVIDASFNPFHAVSLSSLTAGQRYYITLNAASYQNSANYTGLNSFAGIQFNTITPETPVDIHAGSGNQYLPAVLKQRNLVSNSGNFIFWTDTSTGSTHIYGQLYDYTLAKQWNAGSPNPLFTTGSTNFTYAAAVEDEAGGVILAVTSGANIYAKRITSAGAIFDWGAGAQTAADTGFSVRNAAGITNVSIVPVYTGIIQKMRSGVTEMNYLSWGSYIYDHEDIFSSVLIVDGDVVMDETNHDGTTVTKTSQDHTYFIEQAANIIAAGDTYFIADGSTDTTSDTAADHAMNVAPSYTSGTNMVITSHGFTASGWIGNGDVVRTGTSYGRITAGPNSITVSGIDTTNTANTDTPFWIYDGTGTPFSTVAAGDLVQNTSTSSFAHVVTWISDNELILDADIFSTTTQNYAVYTLVESNTGSADIPNRMYKSGAGAAAAGDIVRNTSTASAYVTVSSVNGLDLTLSADIFSPTTQNYSLWDATPSADTGTADGYGANQLISSTSLWLSSPAVSIGDLVMNSAGQYATVTFVMSDITLNLSSDIFPDNTGTPTSVATNHLIVTGRTWLSSPIVSVGDTVVNETTSGSQTVTAVSDDDLTLSGDLFTNTTDTYRIYKGYTIYSGIETGTANSVIPFSLYRSGATWNSMGFTPSQDIVENTVSTSYSLFTGIAAEELTLTSNIFSGTAQGYSLYQRLSVNTASSAVPFHMNRTGATWTTLPVTAGDLVYNSTDTSFAKVVSVNTDEDMTLDTDIFDTILDSYSIFHNFCTTAAHSGTASISPFYSLQVNWNIGITDSTAFSLYNYRGLTGTSDTMPAKPLFDNNPSTSFTLGAPVLAGDIVINFTTLNSPNNPNISTVDTGSYTIHAKALDMTHAGTGMFANGNNYEIIRFLNLNTSSSDIVETGVATAYVANTLRDTTTSFTGAPVVQVGDIVYNLTDDTYATVRAVALNNLTLSADIFDTGNEYYVIIRKKGALFVWQEGTNVLGRIISIVPSGSVPVDLRAAYNIVVGGTTPKAVTDGFGNAIIVYRDTTATPQLQAIKVNGIGTTVVAAVAIDTQAALAETIVDVQSDGNGGAVILYKLSDGTLRVQRMGSGCTRQWGANGMSIGNGADSTSQETMAYKYVDGTTNDIVVVAANVLNNIKAARVGTNSWTWRFIVQHASTQQNPAAFISGTETLIVWDDNRFYSTANLIIGYGIFGLRLDSAGAVLPSWYANSWTGTDYLNGVSVVLNTYQRSLPAVKLFPYNNGNNVMMLWNDYSNAGMNSELVFIDPEATGVPYFPAGISLPY